MMLPYRGLHKEGVQRGPRPPQIDQHARRAAAEVERQWQGRFAVIWAPYRQVFIAISAIKDTDDIPTRYDTSLIRLNDWMNRVNLNAFMRGASSPMTGSVMVGATPGEWSGPA